MTESNVAAARALYPGPVDLVTVFGDPQVVEELRQLIDPDVEAIFDLDIQSAGMETTEGAETVRGVDALFSTWNEWLSVWEEWFVDPTGFEAIDDERVLVLLRGHARSRTHGVAVPIDGANIMTFREGKLARVELFLDAKEPREAAGISA